MLLEVTLAKVSLGTTASVNKMSNLYSQNRYLYVSEKMTNIIIMTNNNDKFTTVKVHKKTKTRLDSIKNDTESYNNLINRLMNENIELKSILRTVEELEKHLAIKRIKESENPNQYIL